MWSRLKTDGEWQLRTFFRVTWCNQDRDWNQWHQSMWMICRDRVGQQRGDWDEPTTRFANQLLSSMQQRSCLPLRTIPHPDLKVLPLYGGQQISDSLNFEVWDVFLKAWKEVVRGWEHRSFHIFYLIQFIFLNPPLMWHSHTSTLRETHVMFPSNQIESVKASAFCRPYSWCGWMRPVQVKRARRQKTHPPHPTNPTQPTPHTRVPSSELPTRLCGMQQQFTGTLTETVNPAGPVADRTHVRCS